MQTLVIYDIPDDKIRYTLKVMKKFYKPMLDSKNRNPLTPEQAQNELAKLYFETSLKDITDHDNVLDLSAEQWEVFLDHLDKKYEAGELT